MDFKQKVNEEIAKEMPFLNKIDIKFSEFKVEDFISKKLLPYLFFTNTVDSKHRLIPVFLSNTQNAIQLPLFYSLALYRTYSDAYLKKTKFKNTFFKQEKIDILDLEGHICRLFSIYFFSNDIVLKSGKGELKFIDFREVVVLENKNRHLGYYKKLEKYFDIINSFKNDLAIKDNPLELIPKMQNHSFNPSTCNGALYFTKYQKTLKKIIVNEQKIFNTIPASRIEYRQGEPEKEKLGHEKTKQGKEINKINEFLIFTHPDNYKSFDEIKKNANWLNTLIFDFTQNTKELPNVLDLIQNEYLARLETGEIKDIYMLFNEKDMSEYIRISEKFKINHTPYLLNREQKRHFSDMHNGRIPNLLNVGKDDVLKNFRDAFNVVRELCKQLHIINLKEKLLDPLFEIRNRYFSFYDPDDLSKKLRDISNDIQKTQDDFFYTSDWNDDFKIIKDLIIKLQKKLANPKITVISKLLENCDSRICVISCNNSEADRNYMIRKLNINNVEFQNPWNIKEPLDILNSYEIVLVFNSNIELNTVLNLNDFRNSIYLLFNDLECSYYNWIHEVQIPKLSSDNQLTQILNIELNDLEKEEKLKKESKGNEDLSNLIEFNIDSFITSILKENRTNKVYTEYIRNKELGQVLLFFKDGTSLAVNENKYFFIHKEDVESLKECHVQAKNLKKDDWIFIIMHDADEFEKLIWTVANDYQEVKRVLEMDEYWREQIRQYISKEAINLDFFRKLLYDNGYDIQSPQAIQTWINGDVYQPRRIDELIKILIKLNVLIGKNEEELVNSIKTVKKLKTKLPHELRKMHVAELNDLEYKSDFDFPQISKKMLQFLDIKTISLII